MIQNRIDDLFLLYNEIDPTLVELEINALPLLCNQIDLTLLESNIVALILLFGGDKVTVSMISSPHNQIKLTVLKLILCFFPDV